jgi:hypothetical protein
MWIDRFRLLRIGSMTYSSEHSSEHSGSIKYQAFLDQLSDCQFLEEGSVPWYYLVFHIIYYFGKQRQ